MRVRAVLLAAALALVPAGARAADLVVWWEDEFFPGEDDAVREMMAAFEKKTGRTVELTFFPQEVLPDRLQSALDAGEPPDFEFGDSTFPPCSGGRGRGGSSSCRRPWARSPR